MSSRRSGRVAAQTKPAVTYREVNSDDDSKEQEAETEPSTKKGKTGAAAQRGKQPQAAGKQGKAKASVYDEEEAEEEEEDDDVIVVEMDEVADDAEMIAAAVKASLQSVAEKADKANAAEEEDDGEEVEVEAEEESATAGKKRKRATQPKQQAAAPKKAKQSKKKTSEAEAEQPEADGEEEEEERKEKAPAAGKKAQARPSSAKKGKKAAAGGEEEPIAVEDGDEEEDDGKAQKAKKPTKPKKEKQPSLLPHIRAVSTATSQTRKLIGAHVGTSGGVHFGPHNAALMGARCFAMDTRSKRRWAAAPYTATVIESFHANMAHYGYSGDAVLPHGSYLTNLGCLSDELWAKSKACIAEELERCEQLGVHRYVFHPGRAATSGAEREDEIKAEKEKKKAAREAAREKARDRKKRMKAGEEVSDEEEEEADAGDSQPALDPKEYLFKPSTPAAVREYITAQPAVRIRSLARLIKALNELLAPAASAKYPSVHILIETMAAVGNQLCSRFEEMRYVIDNIDDPSRIGVCLDTCHVFAADERYDYRQRDGYERVMKEAEDIIGWQYIKGMHMNDSKCALGSHRDRHENIGDGEIGLELFRCVMNDTRWDNLPIVLETPCKTEAKEAAKRKKKAIAAGEPLEGKDGEEVDMDEDDEDDEGDDDEEGEGGKKKGKAKGKGKGAEKGVKVVKEKEDWVKSYSDEIDMLYGLEEKGDRKPVDSNGVKNEVKAEKEEKNDESSEEQKSGGGKAGSKGAKKGVKAEKKEAEDEQKDPEAAAEKGASKGTKKSVKAEKKEADDKEDGEEDAAVGKGGKKGGKVKKVTTTKEEKRKAPAKASKRKSKKDEEEEEEYQEEEDDE